MKVYNFEINCSVIHQYKNKILIYSFFLISKLRYDVLLFASFIVTKDIYLLLLVSRVRSRLNGRWSVLISIRFTRAKFVKCLRVRVGIFVVIMHVEWRGLIFGMIIYQTFLTMCSIDIYSKGKEVIHKPI